MRSIYILFLVFLFGTSFAQLRFYRQLPELALSSHYKVEIKQGAGAYHEIYTYNLVPNATNNATKGDQIAGFGYNPAGGAVQIRVSRKDGVAMTTANSRMMNKTYTDVSTAIEDGSLVMSCTAPYRHLYVKVEDKAQYPLLIFVDPYSDSPIAAGATAYTDATALAKTDYVYMVRPMQNAVAVKLSNTPSVSTPACTPQVVTNNYELAQDWNLVSINVVPDKTDIASVFAGHNVLEVKTMNSFWRKGLPDMFNSLNAIVPGEGYLVYMNEAGTLSVTGVPFNIQNPTFNISIGWQLIGCPYPTATPMAGIFGSKFSMVKNFEGFWMPAGSANSIENLEPGKAYFVK